MKKHPQTYKASAVVRQVDQQMSDTRRFEMLDGSIRICLETVEIIRLERTDEHLEC